MKVLHVLPFDQPRGAQRYAWDLIRQLRLDGQVHEVLTIFEGVGDDRDVQTGLGIRKGFWRDHGLDPRAITGLRRALHRLKPDIVVAHGGESAKYVVLAHVSGPSVIYLNIGSAHPRLRRRRSALLHSFYLRRVDCLVAVSDQLADEAHHLFGVPEERIVVIPNGRDGSLFGAGEPRSAKAKSIKVIWIGQLDEAKRPEWFLDVMRSVLDLGFEVSGIIVGDGPARESLEGLAPRAGVTLLGRRDDVPALLAESDLLVFTGRPPEGMPGVLIEAGLSGLPSVSTRVPGAQDVIEDGVTGLLVDVDDLTGLRDSVVTLVQDPSLRSSMGHAARVRCLERFDIESTTDQWRALFDRLRRA